MSKVNEVYKMLAELNTINNELNEKLEIINYTLNQNCNYLEEIKRIYGEKMIHLTVEHVKDKNAPIPINI